MKTSTVYKMTLLPKILESAQFLKSLGLVESEPSEYVKKYVLNNPDINEALNKTPEQKQVDAVKETLEKRFVP